MCISWLKKIFGTQPEPVPIPDPIPTPDPVPDPIPDPHITGGDLADILHSKFSNIELFISDGDYRLCTDEQIDKFLELDDTNHQVFVNEAYDCDDFAYRLLGQTCIVGWSDLAFGILWTDVHALNCFIDNNRKFWFIEPQSDNRLADLESWQGDISKVRFVMM